MIYSSKSIQSKRAKRKVYRAKSGGKPGTNFQSPLPIESHRMCLIPPATELWHVWKVVYHKTSLKMQCHKQTKTKDAAPGNSLAVQWSGLHAFTANSPGSIPGWRTEISQATQQPPGLPFGRPWRPGMGCRVTLPRPTGCRKGWTLKALLTTSWGGTRAWWVSTVGGACSPSRSAPPES